MLNNQKGWLLIDVMVGMVILSVALLAIGAAYQNAVLSASFAKNESTALRIAQQVAEQLKKNDGAESFDEGTLTINTKDVSGNSFSVPVDKITYQITLTPHLVSGYTNLEAVDISVSWPSNKPKYSPVKLTGYYYSNNAKQK
jgi:Tfp pilus assembly protein PilV